MSHCMQCLAILAVTCSVLRADSVLTRDKATVNGKITKMTDGEITLVARYYSGEKTLTIKKTDAQIIEFNSTTSNSGPPPKAIGLAPPLKESNSRVPSPEPADTIVLARGQQRRLCNLIGIDEELVHCEGKAGEYPRKLVLRIVLGTQ